MRFTQLCISLFKVLIVNILKLVLILDKFRNEILVPQKTNGFRH